LIVFRTLTVMMMMMQANSGSTEWTWAAEADSSKAQPSATDWAATAVESYQCCQRS